MQNAFLGLLFMQRSLAVSNSSSIVLTCLLPCEKGEECDGDVTQVLWGEIVGFSSLVVLGLIGARPLSVRVSRISVRPEPAVGWRRGDGRQPSPRLLL